MLATVMVVSISDFSSPGSPGLRLLHAEQRIIDHRWSWRLCDPFFRLYRNRDDGAAMSCGTRRWAIPAGVPMLIPPWCDVRASCGRTVRHLFVHVEHTGLSPAWVRRHLPEPLVLIREHAGQPLLARLLAELARDIPPGTMAHRPAQRLRCQAAAALAVAMALEQIASPAETISDAASVSDAVVLAAQRTIDAHLAEPLTIAALARAAGLSDDHFARRFQRASGRTVMRWIQERRIAAAADRLLHSDEAVEAIAQATGFANRFHFTRIFTRHIGTPPVAYRRQHR
jgi:AraC-like DNA-binding protein